MTHAPANNGAPLQRRPHPDIDGGWGWVVVFASFSIHIVSKYQGHLKTDNTWMSSLSDVYSSFHTSFVTFLYHSWSNFFTETRNGQETITNTKIVFSVIKILILMRIDFINFYFKTFWLMLIKDPKFLQLLSLFSWFSLINL